MLQVRQNEARGAGGTHSFNNGRCHFIAMVVLRLFTELLLRRSSGHFFFMLGPFRFSSSLSFIAPRPPPPLPEPLTEAAADRPLSECRVQAGSRLSY